MSIAVPRLSAGTSATTGAKISSVMILVVRGGPRTSAGESTGPDSSPPARTSAPRPAASRIQA